MKKSDLVLGNVIKAYKGETEYVITNITEEVVTLNNEKEILLVIGGSLGAKSINDEGRPKLQL